MLEYDQELMERAIAEGWFDGQYISENQVKLICEEKSLNFARVKLWYGQEKNK